MRFPSLAALLIVALPCAAGAEVQFGKSQGSFPVFGPSAEREAYFANQVKEREDTAREIRRARREAADEQRRLETLREIAIADAAARREAARNRNILVRCIEADDAVAETARQRIEIYEDYADAVSRKSPPQVPNRPGFYVPRPVKPEIPRRVVLCPPAGSIVLPYPYPYGTGYGYGSSTKLQINIGKGGRVTGGLTFTSPGIGFGIKAQ